MVKLERSERPRIAKLSGPARGTVVLGLIASGFLAACSRPPAPPAKQTAKEPVDSAVSLVNRVWKVTQSSSGEPGTLYTFLWDGTLVIASAHGKPALGQWRPDGDGLTVIEEGRPYRADILRLTREEFSIRLHNPGEPVEITFAPADQPPIASPAPLATGGIWGTAWRLVDLGGAGVLDGARATLEFPEPGKAVGNGSCNRFFGPVQVSGDSITFGPLGSTRMACEQAVATQEARYLEQLRLAERYGVTGSTLLVYPRGNAKPLRFSRTRP